MPRGLATATKAIDNNKSQQGPFVQRFKLRDGESAVVRFLEQGDEIAWAYVYQLPPAPNRKFGNYEPSLDQDNDGTPCPFKENLTGSPKIRAYLNLIWRDAPDYQKDEKGFNVKDASGKLIQSGVADRVVLWEVGQKVLQQISALDADLKGLSSRDFKIIRAGEGLQTSYTVYPIGDVAPLSKNDKALAEEKYDLNEFIVPKSYEDAKKLLEGESNIAAQESAIDRAQNANVFLNPNK